MTDRNGSALVAGRPPGIDAWDCLETVPGQAAVAAEWRALLAEDYEAFRTAVLESTGRWARSVPCPRRCGCRHEVVQHGPGDIVGVCQCESWNCDDLTLTEADISVWQLSWARLGRALCQALNLDSKPASLGLANTRQIGSWSAAAVPAMLTIQSNAAAFRHVLAELSTRLRGRFILLSPTGRFLDVAGQELLADVAAGFFPLQAHVALTSHGKLRALQAPGELFATFNPQAKSGGEEDVARSALALLERLESEQPLKPPGVLTVFRLYCREELSAAQIARKCRSSKATIIRRLEVIRRRTGLSPSALRKMSGHFEEMEAQFADARAEHIHRKHLIYDRDEE